MAKGFSNEQWRDIRALAHAALELPQSSRATFVQSRSTDPEIALEALSLAEQLDQPPDDDADESASRAGQRIGRFELIDFIGAGGAGQVYSARDSELERIVAIKLLSPHMMGVRGAEERSVREARTASGLNHPNIVTVHEVIRTGSAFAIVMEFVDGVPLRKRCGTAMPRPELLHIGEQIAQALAAAHGAGVVHRDIKPENVIVRPDGHVKVLDFGLARWTDGRDRTAVQTASSIIPAGTLRYMSPEHYYGQPVTAKSDIFAFGLMLYELSTGHYPFSVTSPFEILNSIAKADPLPPIERNPAVPPGVSSTILAMMAKDPAERPTAEEVATALQKCAAPAPVLAEPRPVSKMFGWKWAIALVLFISAAAVAWRFHLTDTPFQQLEQITTLVPENRPTAAAISPDGRFLAYANSDGVFLRAVRSAETTVVNGPNDFVVDHLAWLPDGSRLLASGFADANYQSAIWSLSIAGGTPQQLHNDARFGAPSPDGSRIAFLKGDYSSIWTMSSDGQDAKRLVQGSPEDTFTMVLWSANGHHLGFQRRHYSGQRDLGFVMFDRFYERSLESCNADTGKIVSRLPNIWVRTAVSLAKGRILFLSSLEPGMVYSNVLWEVRMDPETGQFTRQPEKIPTQLQNGSHAFEMTATSDGANLAIVRQSVSEAVFVADFDRAGLRFANSHRLTLDERASYPHAWSADSKSVIFESDRNGSYDLFQQHIDERVPKTIVFTPKRWEVFPQLTPDGKFILYAAGPPEGGTKAYTLMRVPAGGGPLEQVPTKGPMDEFRCSSQATGRCVIRTTVGRSEFVYWDLDPIRGIGRELARTAWLPSLTLDWDISPDGKQIAIPNHDSRSARIRIVRLDAGPGTDKATEVELPRLTDLAGIVWTADGAGWFLTLQTSVGRRMVFCDLHGHVNSLGDMTGWAVPARDGKKVAYLNTITNGNVWMLSNK